MSGYSPGCPATRPGCCGATWRRPGRSGSTKRPRKPEREAREKSDFLAYRNAAGEVADFHATRHTYVSGIVAGGASVKTCQELARHSSPSLTIGRYSHARLHDLQGALDALPSVPPDALDTRAAGIGGDGDRQRPADSRNPTATTSRK